MYSPKIAAALIPSLYWLAKARGVPMTHRVNACLRAMLDTPTVQRELDRVRSAAHQRADEQVPSLLPTLAVGRTSTSAGQRLGHAP